LRMNKVHTRWMEDNNKLYQRMCWEEEIEWPIFYCWKKQLFVMIVMDLILVADVLINFI
jgi:hypothetical protein